MLDPLSRAQGALIPSWEKTVIYVWAHVVCELIFLLSCEGHLAGVWSFKQYSLRCSDFLKGNEAI